MSQRQGTGAGTTDPQAVAGKEMVQSVWWTEGDFQRGCEATVDRAQAKVAYQWLQSLQVAKAPRYLSSDLTWGPGGRAESGEKGIAPVPIEDTAVMLSGKPSQQNLTVSPRLDYSGTISAHCNLYLPGLKTRFCHVGWAGLKLLTSSDPPTLTSQNTGVASMSHCVQPKIYFNYQNGQSLSVISKSPKLDPSVDMHLGQGTGNQLQPDSPLISMSQVLTLFPQLKCSGMVIVHYSLNFMGSNGVSLCCLDWPQTPWHKLSSCPGLTKCWDYRYKPLYLDNGPCFRKKSYDYDLSACR
ncbi:hypothetical protein AAY473_031312 [Plecturocebus cupreus]